MDVSLGESILRFYHDAQWNALHWLGVGTVLRIETALALLADLLDAQGQRQAAIQVREWQRREENGIRGLAQ